MTEAGVAAFEPHVDGYDEVAGSALGLELRERVRQVLAPLLSRHDSVADLGCGTGIDAEWLSARVRRVQAFDVSPGMVARARERCGDLENVTVHVGDAALIQLATPVDVVLANFGVINGVDHQSVRRRLAAMVRPGGHVVVVTLTRWCPIELGVAALTWNRSLLARRRTGAAPGYDGLVVRYASAADIASAMRPELEILHAASLGLVLPPFEQRGLVERRPRLLRVLAATDRRLAGFGAKLGIGDHHIVVLRRCGA